MNKVFLFFLLSSWTAISGFSQGLSGTCGTSAADNYLIRERMMSNRDAWQGRALPRTGAPVYVPVTYWLIAKNDGTGRLPFKNVVDNLCALNKIYASVNMVFYLKAANNINNSFIYDDPSSTLGEAYINQFMLSNKNAVNIFVANAARASDPGVLAFYSPAGDYIVSNKLYVNADGTTLAHEIGHYFSLAHTFFGWEGTVYNTVTSNCTKPTPTIVGNGVLVEYVDRNKAGTGGKKHCEQSADGFCDTPADYNLGLGFQGPGCSYSGCTKDPDDAILDPSEVNLMSYFLNCIRDFSTDQINAITKDYLSAGRNYLRNPVYTPKAEITEQVQYIKPLMDNAPLGYDTVAFDWADVPNATQYIFEVAENTGFNINNRVFLLSRSDTTLANFKKSKVYYWRVYPFNQNSFCVIPRVISFTTPSWTVASENIENSSISSYLYQTQDDECMLQIETDLAQTVDLQWFNANGAMLKAERIRLSPGSQSIAISNLAPGLYFYRLVGTDFRTNTRKFIKS